MGDCPVQLDSEVSGALPLERRLRALIWVLRNFTEGSSAMNQRIWAMLTATAVAISAAAPAVQASDAATMVSNTIQTELGVFVYPKVEQDSATQARLRYAGAVVRFNQSQVDLLAALGLLDETSLAPDAVDG